MTLARHDVPRSRPAPAGRHRAAYTAGHPADDTPGDGKAACLRLFSRLSGFTPASWLALPAAAEDEADENALERVLAGAALTHAYAYAAIAAEAGRARRHGVRDATPPALLLLAAVAHGQNGCSDSHGRTTLQMAASALALAQRQGHLQHERARALHAALLPPGPAADASGHFGTLAAAARAHRAGRPLDALGGFESAGASAGRDGLYWLAGLAWEQAALLAGESGLGTAMQHYRRLALASYGRAGAPGRIGTLRRAWGEDGTADAGDADAGAATALEGERERLLRAGSIGDIGLSIAHEVNQPLAAISLHAAAARKWLRRPQPDIERALASLLLISAAGRHAGDIVRSVQRLASRQDTEMGKVPVDQTIADTLQLLQRPLRKHGIEIDLALGLGECIIQASRVQLQQVVTNLLMNAIEALSGQGGRVLAEGASAARRIHVQSRHVGTDEVEISVADNGPGIAQQNRARIFGSLFSTKPNSTGMGLSISLAIVRAHGGQIGYEPGQPHGACFRFRLPVNARGAA
ncbi:sensor histidine kinase [Herbaspirillum sp. SJZ107]|uniref:sensor histidine kinase n=1 Tax=Herbaspirillum sp. SJZ107 TaxID=2572881 RepID=UPI00114FF8A7|nr:ATP-binding protein [Herbaspirillum sp. SJZ107]TQK04740.1 histidine kinase/DNA gyrase B/HSP90-like ATPase [Herbaspirillum sp. SJZ107]